MKIAMVNSSDLSGGAARAAYRIHRSISAQGLNSVLIVNQKSGDDHSVIGPERQFSRLQKILNAQLGKFPTKLLKTDNKVLHSSAMMPSGRVSELNESDAAVIHLHWINNDMLSIRDIGKLSKPVVWTLHDMWAFCGAEHYSTDYRWRYGYNSNNRPHFEDGFDLNKWVFNRKKSNWTKPFHIVTPSNWLADCARDSVLMGDWPVSVIPNAIDTNIWRPLNQELAREILGFPMNKKLILFGADGGTKDPRKGYDLLENALLNLDEDPEACELVVFGQSAPKTDVKFKFKVNYIGQLNDNISLNILYSSADVMVIPSRQDNLPNTGVEALASGTPIVGFNTCGLPDLIDHKKNGYLAPAFKPKDLAFGISWLTEDKTRTFEIRKNARRYAVEHFSHDVVGLQYKKLYNDILNKSFEV